MYKFYSRYIRHIIVPGIGFLGQDRLFRSKVLCVGAGGLGSSALIYLVSAGIGGIGIVDHDIINLTNLNRQVIFSENNLGESKAYCAKKFLLNLNSNIDVSVYNFKLTHLNISDLIKDYDIILDCTDNLEVKFLINDVALKFKKILVHGSVFGLEGYVSIFSDKTFCYRCLHYDFPGVNSITYGILGAVVGIIGSLQALIVIFLLLKDSNLIRCFFSRVFFFDFNLFKFKVLKFRKSRICFICH